MDAARDDVIAGNDNEAGENAGGDIAAGNVVAGNDGGENINAGVGAQIVGNAVAGNDGGENINAGVGAQEIAVAGNVIDDGGVVIAVRRSARPRKATKRLIHEMGNEQKRKKKWPPVIARGPRTPRVPVVPPVIDVVAEGGAEEGGAEDDVQNGAENDDEAQE